VIAGQLPADSLSKRSQVPAGRSVRSQMAANKQGSPTSIEIVLSRAALGAEISGVYLAQPVDDATSRAIERAYSDQEVIFVRNQHITHHLVAFSATAASGVAETC
jgi:alpha-ketoglutarate-dependent taurine dioxygenase